jgi:hypothetical protein
VIKEINDSNLPKQLKDQFNQSKLNDLRVLMN